jgi:DNA-binding CsgD family transcriptional regulator
MPFQEPLFEHHHVTPAEAEVLRELANGLSAEEIAERLGKTPRAVRATLERFADRTGISARRTVVWSVRHLDCCLAENSA